MANLKKILAERKQYEQDTKDVEERKAQYERVKNAVEVQKEGKFVAFHSLILNKVVIL